MTPTVFVLFGATGDLARRMVLPAFYTLHQQGLLPKEWMLVGNGRGDVSHENFRAHVRSVVGPLNHDFSSRLRFAGGGFQGDDPGSLLNVIEEALAETGKNAQLVHYLAVPPVAFPEITRALGAHGLASGSRVVYEKPFGTSASEFRKLDRLVHSVLSEDQVYRIDHFLGKEATQELHVLRFANEMIGAMWNRNHIEAVQIDVPETLDVKDRAGFYDATGAVLDMLVTHLFQVAAEVAMEPPASFGAADLQAARETVIRSSGRSTRPRWCSGSSPATATWTGSPRVRRPTPTSPPSCGSTIRGGAACRSCCARESGSRRARSE